VGIVVFKPAISILIVGTDRSAILGFAKLSAHAIAIAPVGKSAFGVNRTGFARHVRRLAEEAAEEEVPRPALKAEPAA
jgi:hypothetical protein